MLLLGGCIEASEGVGQRGLGLADGVIGSCVDACGEATPVGNCWCDAACVKHGDCCADAVEVCGGPSPDPLIPALCREVDDCPAGLACDQSACHSGCRDGDECEDACLGLCVEPQQQSLPSPTGTDEPTPEPDGDANDAPAGPEPGVACNCPEGDLCVPLCPVCPPEVPDEECVCTVVCVTL